MSNIIKLDSLRLIGDSSFIANVQCVICQEIPLYPKECQNCQNLFCQDCIGEWLNIKNVCPCFCSENEIKMKGAHKFIRDLISNLRVKCSNYGLGCNENIRYEALNNHEKNNCLFRKIKCPNNSCENEILFKDKKAHETICLPQLIECHECLIKFNNLEFKKHSCMLRLIEEVRALEKKVEGNYIEIDRMKKEVENLTLESQKKHNIHHQVDKIVGSKVKDLKIFMKTEVENIIKGLIKSTPVEKKLPQIENKQIKKKDPEVMFSKFFKNLEDSEDSNKEEEEDNKDEKNNVKEDSEISEEESKNPLNNNCHSNYKNLKWLISPIKAKCDICSENKLIRYKCTKCHKHLCVFCKKPLINKEKCPLKHKLKKESASEILECDICLATIEIGKECFSDALCGFDVCTKCCKVNK